MGPILGQALMTIGGGLLGKLTTPKPKPINLDKLKSLQGNTQGLVDEQLGLSRQLQDPNSAINMQMRNMLSQNSSQQGAQVGQSMEKMGAMTGMSAGQTMMQMRMGQNQAMGGVNDQWMKSLQERFGQGTGIMGKMTGIQQGLDENIGNAYLTNLNTSNKHKQQEATNMMDTATSAFQLRKGQWPTGNGNSTPETN